MLKNVKVYYRDNGKLACTEVAVAENYKTAVWAVRSEVLGCKDNWFDVKGPVMAVVQKGHPIQPVQEAA